MRALGLRPRKGLSQSFLEDEGTAAAIVRAAKLLPDDEVLEVGPGLGVLTRRLARVARHVVAVELDAQLADALRHDLASRTVTVHTADILGVDPANFFSDPYVVVANLPYHITSPALRHLLTAGPPFASRMIVMVQAEVADRIAATPGDMSALAVIIQSQAQVSVVRRVSASAFYPPPKVDSAVVRLEPLTDLQRVVPRDLLSDFTALVHAGFKQPRKRLSNSLADGLGINSREATEQLTRARIDPGLRPEALTVADWVRLFRTA